MIDRPRRFFKLKSNRGATAAGWLNRHTVYEGTRADVPVELGTPIGCIASFACNLVVHSTRSCESEIHAIP